MPGPRYGSRQGAEVKAKRLLGAHVSTAGGLQKSLERARALQCNCMQVFTGNPRGWSGAPVAKAAARAFREAAPVFGVKTVIIHAIYLVNPASPKAEVRRKSLVCLRRDLVSAGRLGASGVVLHPGSDLGDRQGEQRLLTALQQLLPAVPAGCRLLLEGMAGTKNSIGTLEAVGRLARQAGEKIGVCLDSAHLCAAGYDLQTADGFARFVKDVKKHIGFARVGCIHVNDSKHPCGSRRDHHENLGEGYVTARGLRNLLHFHPFRALPFIMETPGFDQLGPDRKNMRRLKKYAG
ncbi:deoxyribonuclease IV [candidate division FCPU426 bacterium]|nr:deoxyribonuclease IV [candidate division FCPU426 bacterium]